MRGRRKYKRLVALAAAGIAGICILAGVLIALHSAKKPVSAGQKVSAAPVTASPTAPAPAYTGAQGRYLFNGTIFWGRAIERDARAAHDFGRALGNISTFDRPAYDAWIADLECPVANLTVPYQRQVQLLNFNCPPEFAPYFTKYFNIIGLANNHTGDQGHDAFLETQQHLTDAGAQVYGSYDISDNENRCEVISLPIKLQKPDNSTQAAAIPVAFCSYHALARMPRPEEVAYIAKYSKIMPTFAFAHMGIEYTPKATASQELLGHEMIDAGADFVIMNHPHWVQNTEAYKGKLIVYSTGNFIFDQLTSEELRSASIDVTLSTSYDSNLASWIKLGDDCKAATLHDTCLTAAKNAGLSKPKVSYKFGLVAGDELTHRWIPQKASPAIQQAVEARANWAETSKNIQK